MKNRVNPEIVEMLDLFPPLDLDNYEAARAAAAQAPLAPQDPNIAINDKIIEGPDGNDLRLRIYEPVSKSEELAGLLWIHGGGYVLGSPEENDALCQQFVNEAGCVVVSVDYRLVPEHPYPAPLEDCYAALKWFADNAKDFGVDANRIGVAGLSAGGGLTAGLSLLARDRKGPEICFQMPLYPMIDDRNNTPSSFEIRGNYIWNHDLNEKGWSFYLNGENGKDDVPIYAAPARATVEELQNLPFTYTCVGQLDAFRDETLTYVTKLAQAGVDVEFHLYPGGYHAYEIVNPEAEISKRTNQEYVNAVKYALNRTSSVSSK
ncbi:alpha/beta hydrolase [Ureibacillus sinduriensis]|uniref:Lipase n=1 Tax=Ureibacillus sinduriensis BLB-1 = JCM 15800 TaxID=1384057 RepID=A0A0A3IJX7_9BACL|nr:alpha/beta hydrolase [Ureibacillus sinduriensis]KGR75172.1 lipase [Ureibacillus sinduriensis BLB-1 = JCM 15800]